jgi:hypothetical protein
LGVPGDAVDGEVTITPVDWARAGAAVIFPA